MTENLGDRIRARRQQRIDNGGPARTVILATAKTYAENLRDAMKTYVDNKIAAAKTYVDNQLDAAKLVSDAYTDDQLAAKIAKLAVDNNLINEP